jgi:signal transduction histidine kinase/ActR/RegA family two-component response regulator
MIAGARNISLLRYSLIILLFSALFISAGYLYLHYRKAQLMHNNIKNIIAARENSALIDSCIIKLYSADNNSRLYTITDNKIYLKNFADDINNVLSIINKIHTQDNGISKQDPEKFKRLIKEKATRTGIYIKLRLLTDSIIRSSVVKTYFFKPVKINQPIQPVKPMVRVEHRITTDTIKPHEKPGKKLIGRILAAFSSKKEEKPKILIVKKDTVIYSNVPGAAGNATANSAYAINNKAVANKIVYTNYYKKLNSANDKLRNTERQELMLNNHLAEEMIASLKAYKALEQSYIAKSKINLNDDLSDVFSAFSKASFFNLIFFIALIILAFYTIWKMFRNEQQLITNSKNAENYALLKGRFLAGMSHEIRTPLNSVIGFSEQLSHEELPPLQKEQIAAIRNSSEMILDLVNEILDFSKYETGKMSFENSPFMVSQVFDEVFTTMRIHALKKHIKLEDDIVIDKDLCCEGDKLRLKQVLMNLLGNAIKFTVKGRVTLHAAIEHKLPGNILLKVKVTDTGLGIDKDDLPHIFDEFSQVADAQKVTKQKGTGLGLAICKKIIELQGGAISVSSTVGMGSTFSFELPLKQIENEGLIVPQTINDAVMAELVRGKNILIAEDNTLNVLLATIILKKWDIKFDVAHDGQEAFRLFKKNNYDLLLTDIQMPIVDGLQLTQLIRNHTNPVKSNMIILVLTANVMKEDRDLYFKTGVNDVIIKPFLERELIEKIALTIQNNHTAQRFVN